MNRAHIILGGLVASALAASEVRATVRDGEPWDWSTYTSIVTRNDARQESVCDAVAHNLEITDLTCEIDHDSWTRFLDAEKQRPFVKRRDALSPWNCGTSFTFFRSYSEGGRMPDKSGDGAPVIAELGKKVKAFKCVMDNDDKPRSLSYDAAKKTLVFHITRAAVDNDSWVGEQLQKMKALFPAINKYWSDGHNM